jgi:hypothetical protein
VNKKKHNKTIKTQPPKPIPFSPNFTNKTTTLTKNPKNIPKPVYVLLVEALYK